MASRFVVAVALFAVCHSSPVLINGVEYRDGRSFTIGEGFSRGYGGVNQASASITGGNAQAYGGNNDGGNVVHDSFGNAYPSQAFAKVGTYDTPEVVGVAKAQPVYYPIPAPQTVVTYQQYADVPAETPAQLAQSTATTNGDGYGIATSNANTGYGVAASNANTQGTGYNTASSIAQTNNVGGIATPIAIPEEIKPAENQGLYTPVAYSPVNQGSAHSNANANGHYGSAASSAKTGAVPTRKSISWRFGTAYDLPAGYANSAANAHLNSGHNTATSTANAHGASSAKSTANTDGAGNGYANSAANSEGGYANANADINNAGYTVLRAGDGFGYGHAKTAANANGYGAANSQANVNANYGLAQSNANSHGHGSAQSHANTGPGYGLRSTGWGGRNVADAHSSGPGNAHSSAKGLSTGYRVVNSAANSSGWGSSRANAVSA